MTNETKVQNARRAVDQLRDFARTHGMDHRQRDPLVMAIHDALDTAPPAPARADEPTMRERLEAVVAPIRRSEQISAADLDVVVSVPPSPAPERPGAEPEKASLRRCITRDMYQCTLLAGHDGYHRYEWEDDLASLHRREQSPHSSPERERAQDTPRLTGQAPWRIEREPNCEAFIYDSTGRDISAELDYYAERIVAAVNVEAELVALREQMAQARELLNRAGKAPYMRAIQLGDDIRAFLAETGVE